jgi:hypothetical protein
LPGTVGSEPPNVGDVLGGVDAKLSQPSDVPNEQSAIETVTRMLKMQERAARFFFMMAAVRVEIGGCYGVGLSEFSSIE